MSETLERIHDVSDLVQVLTGCSSADADRAGADLCKSPEALALLAQACGISTGAVGFGGLVTIVGAAGAASGPVAVAGVPVWAIGLGLTSVSVLSAKRFCSALVRQSGMSVDDAMNLYFKR
jgi:hypothetical protein